MCTECNNNKLTIVELRAENERLRKEIEEISIENQKLSGKVFKLERSVINLAKLLLYDRN